MFSLLKPPPLPPINQSIIEEYLSSKKDDQSEDLGDEPGDIEKTTEKKLLDVIGMLRLKNTELNYNDCIKMIEGVSFLTFHCFFVTSKTHGIYLFTIAHATTLSTT